ncbi:hypothetical protein CYLTODRAFT_494178 [Cylindrobasidium torrendii FP15055 ss-10]|uniref:Uncharacterized protein n=1 Tax=Cylindrobasidium torrendii FP15055 ss-10 TaxID=1314674 RepID=A0A0D7AYN2_9AGAR|nr:hypothetical protein CYLTODRAFT_494178 [Cylindrobasidium torrendii FP15055 ss-10]
MPQHVKQIVAVKMDGLEQVAALTRRALRWAKSLRRLVRTPSQPHAPAPTADAEKDEHQVPSILIRVIACGLCAVPMQSPPTIDIPILPIEIRVTRMSVTSTEPLVYSKTTVWT